MLHQFRLHDHTLRVGKRPAEEPAQHHPEKPAARVRASGHPWVDLMGIVDTQDMGCTRGTVWAVIQGPDHICLLTPSDPAQADHPEVKTPEFLRGTRGNRDDGDVILPPQFDKLRGLRADERELIVGMTHDHRADQLQEIRNATTTICENTNENLHLILTQE